MSTVLQRILAVGAVASAVWLMNPKARGQATEQGPAPAPGKWGGLAPLPVKSEEFTFADVDGKIYLFGGLPVGNQPPLGLVQEYDPSANQWTMKKKMPLAIHHAAAAAYDGKVYLFGGQAQLQQGGPTQIPIANSWAYDPVDDSWKALAPMPTARAAASAAAVDGKIYVIGGASVHPGQKIVSLGATVPHRSIGTNEAYDPATNSWAERTSMPTPRNHAAIGVVNGKIYVIGGRVGSLYITNGSPTNVVEVYDPATDNWGVVGLRMPHPRSGMGWATYEGKIYVAGGEMYNRDFLATLRVVEVYDPATNTWGRIPDMPTARHGVNVAAIGNRLYVIGGHIQGGGTGGAAGNTGVNEVYTLPN
jgi:N-acetylneuraminic acid mutarotase